MTLDARRQLVVGQVRAERAEVGPLRQQHSEHRQLTRHSTMTSQCINNHEAINPSTLGQSYMYTQAF